jgi:hypothetical protein
VVALTYDDGPNEGATAAILDVPDTPRLTAGLLDRIDAAGYATGLLA